MRTRPPQVFFVAPRRLAKPGFNSTLLQASQRSRILDSVVEVSSPIWRLNVELVPTFSTPTIPALQTEPKSRQKSRFPTHTSRRLLVDLIAQYLTLGNREGALDLIVDAQVGAGRRRKAWLESQVTFLINRNEPELAIELFSYIVSVTPPDDPPSPNTALHIIKAASRHNLSLDLRTINRLTDFLANYTESVPNHTIRAIAQLFLDTGAIEQLQRVVDGWANRHMSDASLLSDVTNAVIRYAYDVGDDKTATLWFNLHRRLVVLRTQAISSKDSSPGASTSSVPSAEPPKTRYAEPYLTMAHGLLRKNPRRPWRAIVKMMEQLSEDGLEPHLRIYHTILRGARINKRYDRIWSFWNTMPAATSLFESIPRLRSTKSRRNSQAVTPLVIPNPHTFCFLFSVLDDATSRNYQFQEPRKPSGVELFRYMMDVQLYRHLLRPSHSLSIKPQRIVSKGALNLALRYFMNSHQYPQALVVLQTFLTQKNEFGFNTEPNTRTKWFIDVHVLKRCVGELKARLRNGYIRVFGDASSNDTLNAPVVLGEEEAVEKQETKELSWAECLLGMKLDRQTLSPYLSALKGGVKTSGRLSWRELKSTRAFISRSSTLELLSQALISAKSEKPAQLALPIGYNINEMGNHFTEDVLLPMPSVDQLQTRVTGSWTGNLAKNKDGSSFTTTVVMSEATYPIAILPPGSLHHLLDIVGRCALAAEGISKNADEAIRREVLDRIVQEAEEEMFSKTYKAWRLRRAELGSRRHSP